VDVNSPAGVSGVLSGVEPEARSSSGRVAVGTAREVAVGTGVAVCSENVEGVEVTSALGLGAMAAPEVGLIRVVVGLIGLHAATRIIKLTITGR
jgi:hypothetical protein